MALALFCSYYSAYRLEHIYDMPLKQFNSMVESIGKIEKMKSGDDKTGQADSSGLTGVAGSKMARRMYPPTSTRFRSKRKT